MTYLILLFAAEACLAVVDWKFRLCFWRSPGPASAVVVAGVGLFLAWDAVAIAAGVFLHGASPLMTGVLLAPELPLEEPVFLAFFSYSALLLFAAAELIASRICARMEARR
ncbi:lycopene cyclase domain-containing protein [Sinomonas gamaensis]|uniref:lycopene cyclase domain-containing protein n=1 Tax=Sinomonas gamaensis TaxID=2565624 RepID=UPI001109415E|nr:lycopene cyclase domain-containing protein [Sinomonas gamaensis]